MNTIQIHGNYVPEAALTPEQIHLEHIQKLTEEFESRAITSPSQYTPKATHWLIDQFLPEGDSILAGASFVGKTYVLTNLIATILGLVEHEGLTASRERKVVWITEDDNQILQALSVLNYVEGKTRHDFHANCLLVPAQRIPADMLGPVVRNLVEARGWHEEHNPTLIVIDTMAASLECEDINNAAKASKLLATLRQCWRDFSILITMHTAKAGDSREAMGSVAFKADMQNAFFVNNIDKGEDMRAVGYTKRRANGQIKRMITQLDSVVPQELQDRDGNLVTEWVPKIRLVGQNSEAAEAWDAEHATEGKDSGADMKRKEAEANRYALIQWLTSSPKTASNKSRLAAEAVEAGVSGSLKTAQRHINALLGSEELTLSDGVWLYRSRSESL